MPQTLRRQRLAVGRLHRLQKAVEVHPFAAELRNRRGGAARIAPREVGLLHLHGNQPLVGKALAVLHVLNQNRAELALEVRRRIRRRQQRRVQPAARSSDRGRAARRGSSASRRRRTRRSVSTVLRMLRDIAHELRSPWQAPSSSSHSDLQASQLSALFELFGIFLERTLVRAAISGRATSDFGKSLHDIHLIKIRFPSSRS